METTNTAPAAGDKPAAKPKRTPKAKAAKPKQENPLPTSAPVEPTRLKADPRRWEYPDGTPTTKEQRAYFEQHGKLPPQPKPDKEQG